MRSTHKALALTLLAAATLPAWAGPFLPDTPAVTREFTVFVGNRRVDTNARENTYFAGALRSEAWTREPTYFAGGLRSDAWGREASVEVGPQFCLADLADPPGILDLADITAFVDGFTMQGYIADLAEPGGLFDLADIVAFVSAFVAGCP
jgi:hypothetical protein